MIRISVKGSPDKIEGFLIRGHAGFATPGRDIVCAGVSAVATAALLGLVKRYPEEVRWRILEQGLIYCRLSGRLAEDGPEARDAQVILDVMVLGLKSIQRQYPGFIYFVFRR